MSGNSSVPPSQPGQPNQSIMVGRLRVFDEVNGVRGETFVGEKTPEFRATGTIVNLALCMLETSVGKSRIAEIGQKVIANRAHFEHIYEDDPRNMMWWVELFLVRLRASFPNVLFSSQIGGEGQFSKSNWARNGVRMRQWDPSMSGLMRLNKAIMNNMITAGRNAVNTKDPNELIAYESFMFLMSVTVAHELIHQFVGFLTGYDRPATPEIISFLPELYNSHVNGVSIGESGRAWEGLVFGGTVEAFESRSSPLGARQAGLLFVLDARGQARRLDHSCVKRNLEFNFEFPLKTSGSPIGLIELDRQHRTMKMVRQGISNGGRPLQANRDRRRTTDLAKLHAYARIPSSTIIGAEFNLLLRTPRGPRYLFAAA